MGEAIAPFARTSIENPEVYSSHLKDRKMEAYNAQRLANQQMADKRPRRYKGQIIRDLF